MVHDLIVRNARLRSGRTYDIAITNGVIEKVSDKVEGSAEREIDARGRLATETFVITHLHLDKVMTGSLADEAVLSEYQDSSMGGAMTAVEVASRVKDHYVESEIVGRVRRVLIEAEFFGVSHIRAFADVDPKAQLIGIEALSKIKKEFKGRVDLQVVAFPEDGIIRQPGTEELLYKSMERGADVVGGHSWIEYTDEDARKHVDIVFEVAQRYDADVAIMTDDAGDPDLRTTEYVATSAIRKGWVGRASVYHARATALYNEVYHRKLCALLKKAEMGIATNPHTGPLHVRVKDLLNAGVTVALGQDDVYDAYYSYGRCNMLEVAFLASHLLWMMTPNDRELLYDMITVNPAKIMRIGGYGLTVGNPANIVILSADNLREALAYHTEPLYVIRNGVLRRETQITRTSHDKA